MGVLDITENAKILTVATEFNIYVNVDDYGYDLDTYMKNPGLGHRDVERMLKEGISELEDVGENMSNVRALIQNITKNHEKLSINTTSNSDINGNINMWQLEVLTIPDRQGYMISITLRKKKFAQQNLLNFQKQFGIYLQ